MIIIIFGPPGSGKGTQSGLLVLKYNLKLISVGDILRCNISANSKLGKEIKSTVESGSLIQDKIVCELLYERLTLVDSGGNFLLDGFPRNLFQAHFLTRVLLNTHHRDVDIIIELQLNNEVAINRLKNRLICLDCKGIYNTSDRSVGHLVCMKCKSKKLEVRIDDSSLSIINRRIREYDMQINDLRKYYKDRLLTINANLDIDQVKQEIENKILNFNLTKRYFSL